MSKEKDEKKPDGPPPTIAEALAELGKMGISVAAIGAAQKDMKLAKIPTGLLSLDYILGGGYPRGRIIEIFGWESSGKSTLTLISAAECQRNGGVVALVDAEHCFDPEYATMLGVDVAALIYVEPATGEEGLAVVEKLSSTGKVDMIIVDSVAALVPDVEVQGEVGKQFVGRQASMMSQALRKLTPIIAHSKAVVIFINQIRLKVGIVYGNPETTPAGMALKFYASLRFKVSKKEKLKKKNDDTIYGHLIKVYVEKSKTSQQYLSTDFQLIFGKGFSLVADTVDAALAAGILTKDGTKYMYKDQIVCIGYDKLIETLVADPEYYADIRLAVTNRICELKGVPVSSIKTEGMADDVVTDVKKRGKSK